jgi:hypothetical protein
LENRFTRIAIATKLSIFIQSRVNRKYAPIHNSTAEIIAVIPDVIEFPILVRALSAKAGVTAAKDDMESIATFKAKRLWLDFIRNDLPFDSCMFINIYMTIALK